MAPKWLLLEERLPPKGEVADAIYVPGQCLTLDGSRLTKVNAEIMRMAASLMVRGLATRIIISGCYDGEISAKEIRLRRAILKNFRIKDDAILEIEGITSTTDEFGKLKAVLETIDARSLIIVTHDFHAPRALMVANHLLPDIKVYISWVWTPKYERTLEPSWIKNRITGSIFLSIPFNLFAYFKTRNDIRHTRT